LPWRSTDAGHGHRLDEPVTNAGLAPHRLAQHHPYFWRGTFHSVKDLETAIGTYIECWNQRAHPSAWTKNADEIISHTKPSPHVTIQVSRRARPRGVADLDSW